MRRLVLVAVLALAGGSQASAQDAAAGEKVFAVCKACHQVGDNAKNAVGPVLNGLFGRKAGSVEGYNYSEPNKKSGISWDEARSPNTSRIPRLKYLARRWCSPESR